MTYLSWLTKLRHRLTAFIHDLCMIPLAWVIAFWLRFGNLGSIPEAVVTQALYALPWLVLIQTAMFMQAGLYRGIWRFASLLDLARIMQAVVFGTVLSAFVLFLVTRLDMLPRSVFLIYGLLLVFMLGGGRFVYRWLKDRGDFIREGRRVLIIGAGTPAEGLARDLRRNPLYGCIPVGFISDQKSTKGKEIHGIPVLGAIDELENIVQRLRVDSIMIAMPHSKPSKLRPIVEACERTGASVALLPRWDELMQHGLQQGLQAIRQVSVEDLLGRDPITLDWKSIREGLSEKVLLVSGGGGSIGAELCQQIAELHPLRLIVVDHSEFNLYRLQAQLQQRFPSLDSRLLLADVSDRAYMHRILQTFKPQVIFHAAAYKHVPILQDQTIAAVKNNILGTQVIAEEAVAAGVETFVLISTDKAVDPSNIMGVSKRVAEVFCQNFSDHTATRFITVRFGNVLESTGSVVPLFREQIAKGGPVTVTHPEITRFFMTLHEAAQLILQSAVLGKGGEIFVLDMGQPVKITYLAEMMIRLVGKKPYEDIPILFTGLRPGEKLHEALFHTEESLVKTSCPDIFLAESRRLDWEKIRTWLTTLHELYQQPDVSEQALIASLRDIIPEFQESGMGKQEALQPGTKSQR